jgi:hypothetical protein
MRRDHPVWVWDGLWMAAVVAEVTAKGNDKSVIVRFESGVLLWEAVEPRDPNSQSRDKPRHRVGRRNPG